MTQVAPFDVTTPYPTEIAGTPMATYIDWMRSCWYVTFMSNPAISVPAGFTASGLPVGLQIVGRHRDEWSVLQLAHAFEQATRHGNAGRRCSLEPQWTASAGTRRAFSARDTSAAIRGSIGASSRTKSPSTTASGTPSR